MVQYLVLFTVIAALVMIGLIFVIIKINSAPKNSTKTPSKKHSKHPVIDQSDPYAPVADKAVLEIFNDDFREELRNRGRLHFEKIINDNAMFLQQDLRLTTTQVNEYMKSEITKKLHDEFSNYEESITDAKELALNAITKTQAVIEEQRTALTREVRLQVAKDKDVVIKNFENNMAEIINHYVLEAIGDQIDLTAQLEFILNDLEQNKTAIIEDIKNGA
jgi:hypothetical protein